MIRPHVLAIFALASAACAHTTERERADFERMRVQQKYDLYGTSATFANRQSMQAPPTGTVSREVASDTGSIATGMSGSRFASTIPVSITPELLALGQHEYGIYCAVCHGSGGFGGSIVAEDMGQPRPPSLRSDSLRAQPLGYIFYVATHGRGRMAPYAPQLTTQERWAVVAYIRQLQQAGASSVAQVDDSLRAVRIHTSDSLAAAERKQ